MAAGGGTKAVLAALFANLAIAIAKFVGFAVTRSA
ncbi:MAG: cation transporter, partial [bacterium]|nr:cation transporter [bacterium]